MFCNFFDEAVQKLEAEMEFPACLDEYQKLVNRVSTPRVIIDNAACTTATLVKVDSARNHGILLEEVQVLTDLNLSIKKAYISSDGRWFMDVFHVTDQFGNKIMDEDLIYQMEQSLAIIDQVKLNAINGLTTLELTGADRVGLLSEVFAVLEDLQCDVVKGKVWTHNGRIASLLHIKDCDSCAPPIEYMPKMGMIEVRLGTILNGYTRSAKMSVSLGVTHNERRLHQMMFLDQDYQHEPTPTRSHLLPCVTIQDMAERGYSVVNIQCRDRSKLLFDVVCNLTDMQYDVFHATISTVADQAFLEFFIRRADGVPISAKLEKQRVILCLKAAIERRASKGLRLELKEVDRPGLLADVMRAFRESGLNVTQAEISTMCDSACNIFYVTNEAGGDPEHKAVEEVQKRVGEKELQVKKEAPLSYWMEENEDGEGRTVGLTEAVLSLGSLVRRNLHNLGLVRSYS